MALLQDSSVRDGLIFDLQFTGFVDADVIVSEDDVILRILVQLAYRHYRKEKLHEMVYVSQATCQLLWQEICETNCKKSLF